jgi:hypothetical protein
MAMAMDALVSSPDKRSCRQQAWYLAGMVRTHPDSIKLLCFTPASSGSAVASWRPDLCVIKLRHPRVPRTD